MTDVIAGRFALCDPIARGGSGVVWRAYDRKTEQFCAAKVLRRRDAGDLLRFVREQSVRMSHEHVLTPYSWAAEDAHVVIASELVEGGAVSTLIGDYGPLAEGTVAALLDQLLIALEEVHRAGLVHRDVKPANLLLRATGTGPMQLMLTDFGLAIGSDDAHLTQVGTVVGTPGYLAPEILRGGVSPEPGHDLYAAGRVASALAAGSEPVQIGVPTDLGWLQPGPLRDIVAALGNVDARLRPRSATEARALLAAAPRDATPRTRAGEAIEVLHQLPPLSDAALAELDGRDTITLAASASASASVSASASATASPTTARVATPSADDTRNLARRHNAGHTARLPKRRRRAPLFAGAAVLAAVAVAVPVVLALSGDDDPGRSAPPSSTPTRTSGGSYVAPAVTVNQVCSFTDEGDDRRASGGAQVRCTRQSDGVYVWTRR